MTDPLARNTAMRIAARQVEMQNLGPAFGTANIPAFALGAGPVDITVTMSHPMPSALYTASPVANGAAAGKVTLTVKSRGLGTVLVTASLASGSSTSPAGTLTLICWMT